MKFTADREALLSSLQSVIGVIERRQTMPVLANVLLSGLFGRIGPRVIIRLIVRLRLGLVGVKLLILVKTGRALGQNCN